jgi:hypothetical protein
MDRDMTFQLTLTTPDGQTKTTELLTLPGTR